MKPELLACGVVRMRVEKLAGKCTVAVLADIHGNLLALDAVLADLARLPHNTVILAGDLVQSGPQPFETLQCIYELNVPTIFGNTERDVIEARPGSSIAWWTRKQIGEAGVAYLDALPFAYRISPPQGITPDDDLLAVHATPTSPYAVVVLEPHPSGTTFTRSTPELEAAALLGGARANLIVYGHIHYASSGNIYGQRVESIGSVGFTSMVIRVPPMRS
jgi:predicted phosphodiesterase